MKTFLRIAIAIFALHAAHVSFAGDTPDKPLWAIDIKPKGTKKDTFYYLQDLNKSASNIGVQFTDKNEILITYFRHADVKTSKTMFAALLLHSETGALIKHIEWPVEVNKHDLRIKARFVRENEILITFFRQDKPGGRREKNTGESKTTFTALLLHRATGDLIKRAEWTAQDSKKFNFYELPQDVYLVRINDTLQALDSSLNVVRSKTLDPLPPEQGRKIILPGSGYYFIVDQNVNGKNHIYEVIDWRTFETVEKMSMSGFYIKDIWNDRLLAHSLSKDQEAMIFEKKIGDLAWTSFLIDLPRHPKPDDAKFFYNGAVVVQGHLDNILPSQKMVHTFWLVIENGMRSNPVIYGGDKYEYMMCVFPAKRGFVIGVIVYKPPEFDFFDGTSWTDIWDVKTQQRLRPEIKKNVIARDLSPDGRRFVRLTKKNLEMYAVPGTLEKKE